MKTATFIINAYSNSNLKKKKFNLIYVMDILLETFYMFGDNRKVYLITKQSDKFFRSFELYEIYSTYSL